jgi:hypothetical protein
MNPKLFPWMVAALGFWMTFWPGLVAQHPVWPGMLVIAFGMIGGCMTMDRTEKPAETKFGQPAEDQHAHDYRLISCKPMGGLPFLSTVVLSRCSTCAQHQTGIYAGAWDLSDLLRTEHEVSELDRVARP